jgi:hypothetical protein
MVFEASFGGYVSWRMLDLDKLDVEEIVEALADQTDYEHRWLIDPTTGQVIFWTSDTGIDGQNPVDIDELRQAALRMESRDPTANCHACAGGWSGVPRVLVLSGGVRDGVGGGA